MAEPTCVQKPVVKVTKTKKRRKLDVPGWARKILDEVPLVNYRGTLYRYSSVLSRYIFFEPPSMKNYTDWTSISNQVLGFLPPFSVWVPLQVELLHGAVKVSDVSNRIFFSNGVLASDGGFTPAPGSGQYFNLSVVEAAYDADADCPRWKEWLNERTEPEYQPLLQEFFGYILHPKNHYRKFFILVGPARTGKSTLANVIRMVIGRENISGCDLNKLGTDFGPIETLGKMVNLSTEWGRTGRRINEGILKGFVSGEFMEMSRKFLPSIHAEPTAKLLFAMNELPHFADKSDGLADRMVIIPFFKCIPQDAVIPNFEETFKEECSGIVNWALEGYKRLTTRGFSVTDQMTAAHVQYWKEQSSARLFLDEMTEYTGEGYVERNELFEGYLAWCRRYNEQPLRRERFFGEVRTYYPDVVETQIRTTSGRPRVFRGVVYDLFGG